MQLFDFLRLTIKNSIIPAGAPRDPKPAESHSGVGCITVLESAIGLPGGYQSW